MGHYPAGAEEPGAQGRANVVYALGQIRTVTGATAFQRMQSCGFKIQWSASWVARQPTDMPGYGTKAGDIAVQVVFDRRAEVAADGRDLVARWFIKKDGVVPNAGWAKAIQTTPYPMNFDRFTRC